MPDLSQYDYKKSLRERMKSIVDSTLKFFAGKAYPAVAVMIVAVGVSTVIATQNMSTYSRVPDTKTVNAKGKKFTKTRTIENNTQIAALETSASNSTSQSISAFVIEAEDYDEGGQGKAYYDTTKGNFGNSYRDEDVDIGGSAVVGWIDSGEWLSYEFTTEASGSYDIEANVARQLWQGDFPVYFRLELDGEILSEDVRVSSTGGWANFSNISAGTEYIEAGTHKLVIKFLENEGRTNLMNFNWLSFVPSDGDGDDEVIPTPPPNPTPSPVEDEATLITLQAEDYNTGGEGNAYHDTDAGNNGGEYRSDDVDIEKQRLNDGGHSVGWINGGEWLKYSFNAAGSSTYEMHVRVARYLWQGDVDAGFNVELDGIDVTGFVAVPNTGSWSDWITIKGLDVIIEKGQHELLIKVADNGRIGQFNLDWIKLVPDGMELIDPPAPTLPPPPAPDPDPDPDPTPTPDPDPTPTPNPTPPPPSGNGYVAGIAGPQSNITCSGVSVSPGANLSSLANSKPEGTTFCLKKGTYYGQQVQPKKNQKFIGEKGAILDGQNSKTYAFYSWSENSTYVTIKNLEIKNYNTSQYFGAINMFVGNPNWYSNPVYGPGGWTVQNCYIHNNNAVGIALGRDNVLVENNILNNNEQEGISLRFGKNQRVLNNEIGYNNSNVKYQWGNEAGGSKFWETENMVLDSNWVHNNHGPGLWSDHGNANTTYSNNTVENNFSSGIFHEISFGASVFGNTIKNNGFGWASWYWGAGVQIVNSGPVTIYDNYVEGNKNGIMQTYQNVRGNWGTISSTVYNNTVVNSGGSGTSFVGSPSSSGPFNWYDNTYSGSSFTTGNGN